MKCNLVHSIQSIVHSKIDWTKDCLILRGITVVFQIKVMMLGRIQFAILRICYVLM